MASRREQLLLERLGRRMAEVVELADEVVAFGAPWSARLGRQARRLLQEVEMFAQERRRDCAEALRQLELPAMPKALPPAEDGA